MIDLAPAIHTLLAADDDLTDLLAVERMFTERAPDRFVDVDDTEKSLDPPFLVVVDAGTASFGGTNQTDEFRPTVRVTCLAVGRASAIEIRDAVGAALRGKTPAISGGGAMQLMIESFGVVREPDGVYNAFVQVAATASISRAS